MGVAVCSAFEEKVLACVTSDAALGGYIGVSRGGVCECCTVPSECLVRTSWRRASPTRVSSKSVLEECQARVSPKSVT